MQRLLADNNIFILSHCAKRWKTFECVQMLCSLASKDFWFFSSCNYGINCVCWYEIIIYLVNFVADLYLFMLFVSLFIAF